MGFLSFLATCWFRLLTVLTSAALFLGFIPTNPAAGVPDAGAEARFALLSDVHQESFEQYRIDGWRDALLDMRASEGIDALVLLGDNTMNGQGFEYFRLYNGLAAYANLPAVVAMGNHDMNHTWYSSREAITRHVFWKSAYDGIHAADATDNLLAALPYYSTDIGGYPVIVLGDEEAHEDTTATITQTQLDWFAAEMEAAAQTGKPIFVFLHQPLLHAFNEWGWGSVGDASEDIRAIVEQYSDVFFFSGHLHTVYGSLLEMKTINGVNYFNLPSFLSERTTLGLGYMVDIYADRVELKLRDFIESEFDDTYCWSVPLQAAAQAASAPAAAAEENASSVTAPEATESLPAAAEGDAGTVGTSDPAVLAALPELSDETAAQPSAEDLPQEAGSGLS
ncbi:MAG: metallophosphoesterase [Oscillospiraceae bacterium]|jgi:3',5'-cyclic AMP phosphodiesterase CpdA|nr:metallophosphoesterase [Oscillospiraceae bacterium]